MVPSLDVREELVSFAVTGLEAALSHQFSHIIYTARDTRLIQFNCQPGRSVAMFETLKGRSYDLLKALLSLLAFGRPTTLPLVITSATDT